MNWVVAWQFAQRRQCRSQSAEREVRNLAGWNGEDAVEGAFSGLPEAFSNLGEVYVRDIRPLLMEREYERLAAVEKGNRGAKLGLLFGGLAVVGAVAATMMRIPILFLVVPPVLIGLGVYNYYMKDLRALGQDTKTLIVSAVTQQFGIGFTPHPSRPGAIDRYRALSLVPKYDREEFEDLLTGQHGNARFELFEARLERRRSDSKGRTRYEKVFGGQCLRMEFGKRFFGRTLITRDAGFFRRFGGGKGMKRAALEDPHFEKIFDVYTTDQVESRFLLTPDFMQKLVDLEETFHGGKLKCCFSEGEVLVTVQGGDLFAPASMKKPLDDPFLVRELIDDLVAVFNLMDSITDGRNREEEERGN